MSAICQKCEGELTYDGACIYCQLEEAAIDLMWTLYAPAMRPLSHEEQVDAKVRRQQ